MSESGETITPEGRVNEPPEILMFVNGSEDAKQPIRNSPVKPVENEKMDLDDGPRAHTDIAASTKVSLSISEPIATNLDGKKNTKCDEKPMENNVADDMVTGRPPGSRYLEPNELAWVSFAFSLASFMIALDYSILATAVPKITSTFNSLEDVGWYGSAYMLTEMALQPTWGRAYLFFERKWLYLLTLFIFEAGSIVCATAPNSILLIIGRAIAGVGGSGMLCGSFAIFGGSVPLKQRPFGMALMNSVFAVASLLGPTVGGVFVDTPHLTWRFCFWINLPVGAICAGITWKILKPQPAPQADLPLKQKIVKCDLPGATLLTAGLVCLFIALTWGGNKYDWSNSKVWGCLIGFGLLETAFFIMQFRLGENGTIPMRILTNRTVALGSLYNAMFSIVSICHGYYLSFYFQSVRGYSAAGAGVRGLPYALAGTIFNLSSGWSMSNQGYYVPFMWVGASLYTIGSGLMYTYSVDTSIGKWLGYQVVAGSGLGIAFSVPFIAVQVVFPDDDMPVACAWVVFFRLLGGAIGISAAQNIFSRTLISQLKKIPGANVSAILSAGASNMNLVEFVPEGLLFPVKVAYNAAVRNAFVLGIAASGVAFVCSLFMERLRILDDAPVPAASVSTSEQVSAPGEKSTLELDMERTGVRNVV